MTAGSSLVFWSSDVGFSPGVVAISVGVSMMIVPGSVPVGGT